MSWQDQKRLCKPLKKSRVDEEINRQCRGKVGHSSLESAKKEAERMASKKKQTFNHYWCEFCEHFHIGRAGWLDK